MDIPPKDQFDRIFALIEEFDELSKEKREAEIEKLEAQGEPSQVLTYIRLNYSMPVAPAGAFKPGDRVANHYTIKEEIGKGGMGIVYRGVQDQTGQPVAIKLIQPRLITKSLLKRFAEEIETLGQLDHPNIVNVIDADITGPGDRIPDTLFLVMRFIEGQALHDHLGDNPAPQREAARILAEICGGLNYVHERGIIHRDIKPSNIVVRPDGRPVIVDFGVSLAERGYGDEDESIAGTPVFMSPEIARAEGHLIDGRSDIFSVGVILYRYLAGKLPFPQGEDLMRRIMEVTPPPPQGDPEIVRICMKAISKRASDRFQTARLFADDLEFYLQQEGPDLQPAADLELAPKPKGLRAFEASDCEQFISLLPGPKDRSGLPESLAFWKKGISSREEAVAFRAGVIYGPSGCGKSSLLRAGILPRLDASISTIHIDGDTRRVEEDLLNGGTKLLPDGAAPKTAAACLGQLRKRDDGKKTLIVIDQFEQWLHTWDGKANCDLVHALRQCDGVSVQCVLIVRDEFWRQVTQFLREIEVTLRPSYNAAMVDLFDREHASKVLGSLGHASGKLPAADKRTVEQQRFISQVIGGFENDGQVVPVHLALFCQMFEKHPWNQEELDKVGGIDGIGMKFLDGVLAASEDDRGLRETVTSILSNILPPEDTNIRASSTSLTDLARAAGRKPESADFENAISLLDKKNRLLTPVIDEEKSAEPAYKLTHDYLVPTIRKWFLAKKSATRRGRAELQLDQLATAWKASPIKRNRPSLLEWLQIQCLTRRSRWTEDQRKLMRSSTRRWVSGMGAAAVILLFAGVMFWGNVEGSRVAHAVLSTRTEALGTYLKPYRWVRWWADNRLDQAIEDHRPGSAEHLHAHLIRLKDDPERLGPAWDALQTASPSEFRAIYDIIQDAGDKVVAAFDRQIIDAPHSDRMALLRWLSDPKNPELQGTVIDWVLKQPMLEQIGWARLMTSSGHELVSSLLAIVEADPVDPHDEEKLKEYHQRTAGAANLLRVLNRPEPYWKTFLKLEERGVASVMIESVADIFDDPDEILEHLSSVEFLTKPESEEELSLEEQNELRERLVLALGELSVSRVGGERVGKVIGPMIDRRHSYGLASAGRWCLRQWGIPPPKRALLSPPVLKWWDTENETMIVIREPGLDPFAIADLEVTKVQWKAFMADNPNEIVGSSPPAAGMNLMQARAYCNWRTRQTFGIDQQYYMEEIGADGRVAAYHITPQSKGRIGYRLPTFDEWWAAWTARADGNHWAGASPLVTDAYAWTASNSGHRLRAVASLKPNGNGLYDQHGNAGEWCDLDPDHPQKNEFRKNTGGTSYMVAGFFPTPPGGNKTPGAFRNLSAGFRIAQNLPPGRGE